MIQADALGLEIETALVVSTGHITERDNDILTKIEKNDSDSLLIYNSLIVDPFEFGWYIYVTSDSELLDEELQTLDQTHLSDEFLNLMQLAHNLDCVRLKIDSDGPVSPKLKQFNW